MYTPQQYLINQPIRTLIGFDTLIIAKETSLINLLNLLRSRLSNYTQKRGLQLLYLIPNFLSKLSFVLITRGNNLMMSLIGKYVGNFWKKTLNFSALKLREVITKNVLILNQIANIIDYFPFIRDEDPGDLLVGIVIRDSIC